MQAVAKFKNLAPGANHALFAGILSCIRWDLSRSIRTTNLTFYRFTHSRFTEGGLKFKKWPLDPDHAPFANNLSLMRWDYPRSIHIPNVKFLASPVPQIGYGIGAIKWLGARGGVPNLTPGSPSFFIRPHQIRHQ